MRSLVSLVILSVLTLLIVACDPDGTNATISPTTPSADSTVLQLATVHMNDEQFVQDMITIKKGERVTLVDDSAATHIVANGTWQSGLPQYAIEPGAPKINATLSGKESQMVGPFNTAGTFHLYCTIHQNMGLTVVVHE